MELTMASQPDSTPWEVPPPLDLPSEPSLLSGRAYFSQLGTVRRKPARADAPPTLSKSCSDKIALKQCTSLLSSVTALLVHPGNVYLSSLVLPQEQFDAKACERAFSGAGRMEGLVGRKWEGGYGFSPFVVTTTEREFWYSKRAVAERSERSGASGLAAAWSKRGLEEGLVGGVLQGRKQFDHRGASGTSGTSRRRMWELALDVARIDDGEGSGDIRRELEKRCYGDVKEGSLLGDRSKVKDVVRAEALKGWVRNEGDEVFRL